MIKMFLLFFIFVAKCSCFDGSNSIKLMPFTHFRGDVTLPGSKSIAGRVLLLAGLSKGNTLIRNLPTGDDTNVMKNALKQLGVSMEEREDGLLVKGNNGPFICSESVSNNLFLGNAGTAMRPLTAVLCAGRGSFLLDGSARMRERPIKDLVSALRELGAREVSCGASGCPPVSVRASGLRGGECALSCAASSQFVSALLLAAPLAREPVLLRAHGPLASRPYVDMTLALMAGFGVGVEETGLNRFLVTPQTYRPPAREGARADSEEAGEIEVEGDASAASYFLAGGAILGGPVTVHGCGLRSLQGDVAFAEVLRRMGARVEVRADSVTVRGSEDGRLRAVDEDCARIPDAAMTLAVAAVFAEGTTVIRNIGSWRVKECDRIAALTAELRRLGVRVRCSADSMEVEGLASGQRLRRGVVLETYDDHRMAMSLSLAACATEAVTILDPACVNKTFPGFFSQLALLTS